MLEIKNLHVAIEDGTKKILNGLNLKIADGEVAAIKAPLGRVIREFEERRVGTTTAQVRVGRDAHAVGPRVGREDKIVLLRHQGDTTAPGDAADEGHIRLQHVEAAPVGRDPTGEPGRAEAKAVSGVDQVHGHRRRAVTLLGVGDLGMGDRAEYDRHDHRPVQRARQDGIFPGVHAGGLIISRMPISDLVPLTKRKDSPQASAWVEGLNGQDLQPVGLIKFDLLVISNLLQIARCCDLIKKRHNIDGIFARPGESDWTDVQAWRSDKKALALANAGDMKCIFQFDSDGIRKLVVDGGVDRFEDLVAYAALYRPGPLNEKMHTRYVERKRGREKFSLHPLLQPVLSKTYGVMVYQEQIMKILHIVGNIPLKDCEIVRKAISKKKIELFIKYKEMFIVTTLLLHQLA